MPNHTGSHEVLQAFNTSCEMHDTPLEEFISNRLEPFLKATDENDLASVLRDVYCAGLRDSSFTIGQMACDDRR